MPSLWHVVVPLHWNPASQVTDTASPVLPVMESAVALSEPATLVEVQSFRVHVVPSPWYPVLHEQVNAPTVSVHAALALQVSVAAKHSSTLTHVGESHAPLVQVAMPEAV